MTQHCDVYIVELYVTVNNINILHCTTMFYGKFMSPATTKRTRSSCEVPNIFFPPILTKFEMYRQIFRRVRNVAKGDY